MAIDKNKLIRYRVYDRCFSNFNKMYTRSIAAQQGERRFAAGIFLKKGEQFYCIISCSLQKKVVILHRKSNNHY